MALTWATGVRLGHATRRFERENKLYLAANCPRRFGSSSGPKKRLFLLVFSIFMFFQVFWVFCFWACVWPVSFEQSELNFEKNSFSLQIPWPLWLQFGGWGRTTRVFVESTCNLHFFRFTRYIRSVVNDSENKILLIRK
ncbi:hypothetical protein Hanom_Chr03g00183281 [Helianthus anomalus]